MYNNEYSNKNCVVTGGSGFIGQSIVNALVDLGSNVYVMDNFSYGAQRASVNPKATIIEGDIRDDATFGQLPKIHFDYFFHFAAPSSITLFKRNAEECVDITVRGFLNSIKYCSQQNIRLVFPSTGSLYAGTNPPQSEKAQIIPETINSYAQAKVALEYIQAAYGDKTNSLGLRIFAGYGPAERHKGDFASVVYSFCQNMVAGVAPEIWGDGKQERDFVFIGDVVDIILTLAPSCPEKIINIGTGTSVSFNQIIQEVNSQLENPVTPVYKPKPNQYLEKTLADTTLLRKYYSKEFTPLKAGVQAIIESLKS